ncbi:MAG: heavy metal translocating P-type ATPase [Acidimicrobiales bacterium]
MTTGDHPAPIRRPGASGSAGGEPVGYGGPETSPIRPGSIWTRLTGGLTAALVAAAGFVAGLAFDAIGWPTVAVAAYAAGILVGGWEPGREGLQALRERRLDVDLLMVLAAVAAAGLGQWRDGSLLILIFATTGALEAMATARTAAGVRALLVEAPEMAERLDVHGEPSPVAADQLEVGDRILVRPGARIPVDGVVVEGEAAIDESSLTGEAIPARRTVGRGVLAGSTVAEGAVVVEVTKTAADSTLARLAAAVDEAVEQQPPTQLFIERFEQRYSVGVVVAALAIVVIGPWWWGWSLDETVIRTMTFLVVASPCAVVLATMPATLSALAAAARHRVLIRGGAVLEHLADIDVAAFDKTGTLTEGSVRVVDVVVLPGPGPALGGDELLGLAAAVERWSEHPIGRAVVVAADERGLAAGPATGVEIIPSRGVSGTVGDRRVRVGGAALIPSLADVEIRGRSTSADAGVLAAPDAPQAGPVETGPVETGLVETGLVETGLVEGGIVGVELDGALRGLLVLDDAVRANAACTVTCLVDGGVRETWLLTGDRARPAATVAAATGVDRQAHDLLPHEKAEAVQRLGADGGRVVYVGDGVNDAAALAFASVGVSLAQGGSALAIDAADMILMDDDLHRLPDVAQLARRTRRLVRANLAFAVTVIVVLVGLDLAGRLPLVLGVVGHEGSSVIVALNGLRLLRWRPRRPPQAHLPPRAAAPAGPEPVAG